MADDSLQSSSAQPFQVRDVRELSFLARLIGSKQAGEAETAIMNLIAQRGLENVDIIAIDDCLHEYGVHSDAAKEVLRKVWRRAVEQFVSTDAVLDSAEATFLERLQTVLGIGEVEAATECDKILVAQFMERARPLISRSDATSAMQTRA